MKYKVVFRERTGGSGEKTDDPASFLDTQLDDETVLDAALVGRNRPEALHSSELIEEDDGFLSIGTETWEYEIAEGKDQDFKDAMANSGVVMEFELLESADELGVS